VSRVVLVEDFLVVFFAATLGMNLVPFYFIGRGRIRKTGKNLLVFFKNSL